MATKLVLTIIADDRTGLVEKVANAVAAAGGNWLESSMSHLAGKFAGIALVETTDRGQLENNLTALNEGGLQVRIDDNCPQETADTGQAMVLEVVAHDRPGIVQEFTALLASLHVNVESLDTTCGIAPMSSEHLFEAAAVVSLPDGLDEDGLEKRLGELSDDLMVELYELHDDQDEEN